MSLRPLLFGLGCDFFFFIFFIIWLLLTRFQIDRGVSLGWDDWALSLFFVLGKNNNNFIIRPRRKGGQLTGNQNKQKNEIERERNG